MEKKSMGRFIAELRKANGMTQKQLAEKVNVSDKAVSRWEREESAPDLSLIPVLAELFQITTDELLAGGRNHKGAGYTGGEKRLKYLLSSVQKQYMIRCIISYTMIVAALIFVWVLMEARGSLHDLGVVMGIVGLFVALVYQTIATIQVFISIGNWECDYDAEKLQELKQYIIKMDKRVFRTGIFCFVLMLLRMYWLEGVELLILGTFWEGLAILACTIVFRIVDKRILQNICCGSTDSQ